MDDAVKRFKRVHVSSARYISTPREMQAFHYNGLSYDDEATALLCATKPDLTMVNTSQNINCMPYVEGTGHPLPCLTSSAL